MRILSAVLVLLVYQSFCDANIWLKKRKTHKCKTLKEAAMVRLAEGYNENRFHNTLLRPILRVRVPDTPGHAVVQQHIRGTLSGLSGWTVEDDQFTADTVIGRKTFNNIIAKYNPDAERFLTLACHYDSKLMGNFIGATDSAVPCAMLLETAITLTPTLEEKRLSKYGMGEVGLQLIFFDGEEAFQSWTSTDSIYGARHLAEKMEQATKRVEREITVNQLEQMDLMILLDLIGAGNSKFYNWFPQKSGPAFERMQKIERSLLSKRDSQGRPLISNTYFQSRSMSGAGIEDDHIPFKKRDVPVLHMIAYPFPSVWHTEADNAAALNNAEIRDINLIMKVFVCEYLRLAC